MPFCSRCGLRVGMHDIYCCRCGNQVTPGAEGTPSQGCRWPGTSWQTCRFCGGTGNDPEVVRPCPTCGGEGQVRVRDPANPCDHCGGSGRNPDLATNPCPVCGGSGYAETIRG